MLRQSNKNITLILYGATLVAGFLSLYRFWVFVYFETAMDTVIVCNHLTSIVAMGVIALWCLADSTYRDKTNVTEYEEEKMKTLSLTAAICCLLRVITAIVYFAQKMEPTTLIQDIYVTCDVILWGMLTAFFFYVWKDLKKRDSHRHSSHRSSARGENNPESKEHGEHHKKHHHSKKNKDSILDWGNFHKSLIQLLRTVGF